MSFNYLRSYCKLLENTEVPPRFTIWCGIASLLAALERRVWINQGIYTIYPNFYMVLVAASGQKKSTAVNLCSRLLRKLQPGPNVIAQKITPEALIGALRKTSEDTHSLGAVKCGGIVIADELATFLDRSALDRGLGPILTALYDCTSFEYQTMKRGTEKVEDGYLSMLGGTTIELLKNSLPKDAIGGGFTSRTMFIYEDKTPPPVAWIDADPMMEDLEQELVNYLQRVMELSGSIRLTPEAKEFFIADYNARRSREETKQPMLRNYENRRHAHLLKVATAIMICEEPGLVMDYSHVSTAKVLLEEAEQYLPRVMELVTASDIGLATSLVLQFIQSQGSISRPLLVKHFSHQYLAEELNRILNTLVVGQRIKIDSEGTKLIYRAV